MLRIHDELFELTDPRLPAALASIYGTEVRPVCTCRKEGVAMYISKVADTYMVKRMPNSGPDHAADCDSYEPPPEVSGLSPLMGSAITEDATAGQTMLKLGFSLTKVAGTKAPSSAQLEKDSVKTDGSKLTLRGTLHYLWEQAGLNRWLPAMTGKRPWQVIRKYLLLAAGNKVAKGNALLEHLYIPEPFTVDRKAEIAQRRMARMATMARVGSSPRETRRLMLVIGEVAEVGKSRVGFRIRFKHVPDCDFMMNADLHARLHKRFATEIELWNSNQAKGVHLMAIATASVTAAGIPSFEEIALMVVSPGWIPFESQFELMLLDTLVEKQRRFVKGLRYNLASTTPLASVVLPDTQPQPTAMYIVPCGASEAFLQEMADLIEGSRLASWKWTLGTVGMPPIPISNDAIRKTADHGSLSTSHRNILCQSATG
jgi:hypothetical protein